MGKIAGANGIAATEDIPSSKARAIALPRRQPTPPAPMLSALVVARDEAERLPDCLASLGFADEIVVTLDRCRDHSAAVARRAGAQIVEGAWDLEGPRRNAGIAACRGA